MSDSSFTLKTIRVTVVLGEGSFGGRGNGKVIEGLATEVSVTKPGPPEKNKASVKVTGLSLKDMEQMTTLAFRALPKQKNHVTIQAGTQGQSALSTVFWGEIISAWADFNQAPDVLFNIEAQTGSYPAIMATPQETVNGTVPAADLIEKYAKLAGYTFKNEGVSASVKNAVFNGDPIAKMRNICNQVGCELLIDDGEVVILPSGGTRTGNAVFLSKDSGMLGYPTFSNEGIDVKCLYNPELKIGGVIKVESITPRASGLWKVTKLEHSLSAYKPGGGSWTSAMSGTWVSE